jgi:MFS family permease
MTPPPITLTRTSTILVGVTGVWDPNRRGVTIGLIMTVTLIAFEGLAVSTIMPAVRADLGGYRLYGWAFSAFFLGSLVSTVLAGRAADRQGVGPPFTAGVALFAAGLAIGAAAPTMLTLVIGRAVQGLGAGAVSATATTTVARGYSPELRPRMFALMSTAWVVPGLIGPGISGVVADTIGWRWVFGGLLPILAVSAAIAVPRLQVLRPEPSAAVAAASSARASTAVLLAVATGVVLTGLGERRIAVALPLIAIGAAGTVRALNRLLPAGTLRARRGLPSAVLLKGVLTFAFFGTDAYISLTVSAVRHRSVTFAGLALTAATLSWTAGAWINARRGDRVAPRQTIALGFGLIVVGIVLMHLSLFDAAPLATVVIAWGVAGLGMGMAYQAVTLAVLTEAAAGQEGTASASQQLADLLGVATGTGVVGAIVALGAASGWHTATALRIGFGVTLATALGGMALTRRLGASGRSAPGPGPAAPPTLWSAESGPTPP